MSGTMRDAWGRFGEAWATVGRLLMRKMGIYAAYAWVVKAFGEKR